MKSRIIWKWSLGVCLTVLPFAGGCLQGTSKPVTTNSVPAASVTTSNAAPVEDEEDAAALAAAATNAPAVDIAEAEVKPIADDKPLAASVRAEGPAGELLKLAASGVEEPVILQYITNSPNIFNLSADEIIYLKDLGMSGTVMTAALQRDQELKAQGVQVPAQAAVAPATPQDTTPLNYGGITTNWIGTQPAPDQVAPQAVSPPQAEAQPPAPTDQPAQTVAAPQVQVTYSSFYSSLAPYGTWLEVEGYGRVWQPTVVVVNSGWQPYFDGGRWIYTDHGWYWASDYSWGWAPFHYGRWFRHHRIGWCWAPDYVWGPAWVTWRYNDAYCGWAPLPPAAYYRPGFGFSYYGRSVGFGFSFGLGYDCYSFVHWNRFHHRHHHLHAVPRHHAHDIYKHTKPVTRIVSQKNSIINEGIPAQRVAAATRTEVRKVSIRETRKPSELGGRPERFDPARRTLTVYKPEPGKNEKVERAGGIPMERVRTGMAQSGVRNGGSASASSALNQRPRTPGVAEGRSESRISGNGAGSVTRPATTRPGSIAATPQTPVTRPEGTIARPERRDTETKTTVRPAPNTLGQNPAVAERNARTSTPNRESTITPGPSTRESTIQRPSTVDRREIARPQLNSPSPNSGAGANVTRNFSAPVQRPAQTPSSSSQFTPQTPRVERQPVTRPNSQSFAASPSAPTAVPRQYTAPSAVPTPSTPAPVQRQFSAPAPVQRQYSAPQATPRSYSAPTPSTPAPIQRQYSAPAPVQRQYSAPAQPPVQREFSAPAQRQFSAPSAPSAPQRSYSAPAAPQRSFTPPPQASSRGGGDGPRSGGGGGGRSRDH